MSTFTKLKEATVARNHIPGQQDRRAAILAKLAASRSVGAVLTERGVEVVALADLFDETVLDCFWREVLVYLVTGSDDGLREFRGIELGGRELLSDPVRVSAWFEGRNGGSQ
jgi:hypothetical protein